jgi:hypothetical protein
MANENHRVLTGSDTSEQRLPHSRRPSWRRLAVALMVAVVSDLIGFGAELVPPLQWTVDLATAFMLFLIFGRRWAILPGLVAEAIPGLGVFPIWVLVVVSIIVYDDIKARKN